MGWFLLVYGLGGFMVVLWVVGCMKRLQGQKPGARGTVGNSLVLSHGYFTQIEGYEIRLRNWIGVQ